jgi:hypothetical protein
VLGYVAEDCLGFLLPDTGQDGAPQLHAQRAHA